MGIAVLFKENISLLDPFFLMLFGKKQKIEVWFPFNSGVYLFFRKGRLASGLK